MRACTDHSTPLQLAGCNLIADYQICNMPFINYLRKKGYKHREIIFPPGPPIAHPDARDTGFAAAKSRRYAECRS
jgi:hypothetical protein